MISKKNRLLAAIFGGAFFYLCVVLLPAAVFAQDDVQHAQDIQLLAPLDPGTTSIPNNGDPFDIWESYFRTAAPWLYAVALGVVVIWTLISGIMVMVSGDDASLRQKAFSQMKWSIGGLIILSFANVILKFLNSAFFT